jgi:hypothetical protein
MDGKKQKKNIPCPLVYDASKRPLCAPSRFISRLLVGDGLPEFILFPSKSEPFGSVDDGMVLFHKCFHRYWTQPANSLCQFAVFPCRPQTGNSSHARINLGNGLKQRPRRFPIMDIQRRIQAGRKIDGISKGRH